MSCDNFGDMMTIGIGTTKLIGVLIVLVGTLVWAGCNDSSPEIISTASIDPFHAELACAKLHLWGEWQEQESDFDVVRGIYVEAINAARRGDAVLYFSLVNYLSSIDREFDQDFDWVVGYLQLPDEDKWVMSYRGHGDDEFRNWASPDDEAILTSARRCRQIGIEVWDGWDGPGS
jgi:hypothetical protein